jgi:hypothetical protein
MIWSVEETMLEVCCIIGGGVAFFLLLIGWANHFHLKSENDLK